MLSSSSFRRDAPFPPGGTPPMPRCGYMDMAATPQLYLLLFDSVGDGDGAWCRRWSAGHSCWLFLKDVVCYCWLVGPSAEPGCEGWVGPALVVVGWGLSLCGNAIQARGLGLSSVFSRRRWDGELHRRLMTTALGSKAGRRRDGR